MSRRARIITGILIAVIIAAGAGIVVSARRLEPRLRDWVTSTLSESLESEVELGSMTLNWVPLRLHAENLSVRHHGRTDVPPLLVVKSFSVDLRPTDLWSSTVEHVKVDGLEVNIPRRDQATGKRLLPTPSGGGDSHDSGGLVVKRLTATNTRLAIVPREAGKNPKVWDIFELEMRNLRSGEPATFTASLVNPIPYGEIETTGTFGPWRSDAPGESPIAGDYTFAADLGTIQGLSGDLNALGKMQGSIERISTSGQTRTDKFRLSELDGDAPPAYGRLEIDSAFDLPQGKEPILTRVQLEGSVRAERVTFANDAVQDKIDELSRRGQGKPGDTSIHEVASRLSTRFALKDGVFTYQALTFNVQGADVRLNGTHSLRSKSLNLAGEVRLKATASQTMSGFRSWLLKPFDPLFRRNGAGTRLVIRVEGTQDRPKVGLQVGRTLRGS